MQPKVENYQIYPLDIPKHLYSILCLATDGKTYKFVETFKDDEYLFSKHDSKLNKDVVKLLNKRLKDIQKED